MDLEDNPDTIDAGTILELFFEQAARSAGAHLDSRRKKMHRKTGLALTLALGVASAAFGQTASTTPAPSAPAGGTMHSESTTKHTGAGPNTKVKTETVIGTVKTYDAGKKITVTGPKNKDYSFDLDENVSMAGSSVNVGDRVKVSYTKDSSGSKATTIAPYTGKVKAKKAA
jgi:hypothetical protein